MAGLNIPSYTDTLASNGGADSTITLTNATTGIPIGCILTIWDSDTPGTVWQVVANDTSGKKLTVRYAPNFSPPGSALYGGATLAAYTTSATASIFVPAQFVYSQNYAQTAN